MSEVFISYSSEDSALVGYILGKMQTKSISCWFAPQFGAIPGGDDYAEKIDRAISNCTALLFLATKNACASEHTLREIQLAMQARKKIIPLILEKKLRLPGGFRYRLALAQTIQADDLNSDWLDILAQSLSKLGVQVANRESNKQNFSRRKRRPVDDGLFPYLANRHTQIDLIEKVLEDQLEARPHRPVMLIVHGEESQRCDRFVERLIHHSIPKHFRRLKRSDNFERQNVRWPDLTSEEGQSAAAKRIETYRREVARKLNLPANAQPKAMAERIELIRQPVLLYSLVGQRDWTTDEPLLFEGIGQFWSQFSDLPLMSQPMIIIVGVSYRLPKTSLISRIFGTKGDKGVLGTLRTLRQNYGQKLQHVLLPELVSLRKSDVEDWVREELRPVEEDEMLRFISALFDGNWKTAENSLLGILKPDEIAQLMHHVRNFVVDDLDLEGSRISMESIAPLLKQLSRPEEKFRMI